MTNFTAKVLATVRRSRSARSRPMATSPRLAGRPGAARAVGNIMRDLRGARCSLSPGDCRGRRLGRYGRATALERALLQAKESWSERRIRDFEDCRWAPRAGTSADRDVDHPPWTIPGQRGATMATSKATRPRRSRPPRPGLARADEFALVERCRAGDLAAFETIYKVHAGRLYSVACRVLGNPADAEDLLGNLPRGASQAGYFSRRLDARDLVLPSGP